jgi:hypothetical protein
MRTIFVDFAKMMHPNNPRKGSLVMGFQDILKAVWESDILRLSLDGLLKLGLAALFGGFIGYEREQSHRPAGFRTHILVAVGSALVMLTSTYILKCIKNNQTSTRRVSAHRSSAASVSSARAPSCAKGSALRG